MCFKHPVPVCQISANDNADAESMYNLCCTLPLLPSLSSPTRNLHKRYKKRLSTIKRLAAYNSASQLESATEAWVRQMLVSMFSYTKSKVCKLYRVKPLDTRHAFTPADPKHKNKTSKDNNSKHSLKTLNRCKLAASANPCKTIWEIGKVQTCKIEWSV